MRELLFFIPLSGLSRAILGPFIFQNETSKATRDPAQRVREMAVEFLPALVITLINVGFPFVFDILVRLEVYRLEREVQVGRSPSFT